jgi:hypothetical protein
VQTRWQRRSGEQVSLDSEQHVWLSNDIVTEEYQRTLKIGEKFLNFAKRM